MTVDGITWPMPTPFLVIATQNPVEYEGTFSLPEAQLDRFIVRTSLGYPSLEAELTIVDAQLHGHPIDTLEPVVALDELPILFEAHEEVYIDPLLKRWSVELVRATRGIDLVDVGASVRGSLALERMARALALVLGRDYVVAEDIERLFPLVVMHRMVATADVIMEGLSGDELADRVWQACLAQAPRPEPTWDAEAATAEA